MIRMNWGKKKFEFWPFSWSAAITARFTAEAKEVPAPQFFNFFWLNIKKIITIFNIINFWDVIFPYFDKIQEIVLFNFGTIYIF